MRRGRRQVKEVKAFLGTSSDPAETTRREEAGPTPGCCRLGSFEMSDDQMNDDPSDHSGSVDCCRHGSFDREAR
jgi:hypothetical protein